MLQIGWPGRISLVRKHCKNSLAKQMYYMITLYIGQPKFKRQPIIRNGLDK